MQALGRLRVNKFYEIVGIDILMHTMSDTIGENDDFDRDSRAQQYQQDQNKALLKRKMNASEDYQESHDQKIKSYQINDQLELEYQ